MKTLIPGLPMLPSVPAVRRFCAIAAFVAWAVAFTGPAEAQVAIPGTRIVYPAAQGEVVVPIKNMGSVPVLVQAWISDGEPDQPPEASKAPFVLAPPVVRLEAGKDNHLRIRGIAAMAPRDNVEHLYWLNILGVPPKRSDASQNVLELAVRSRYKVLYRPEGLAPPGPDRDKDLTFRLLGDGDGQRLQISNRSPYVINLGTLALIHGAREEELDNPFIPPRASIEIAVPPGVTGTAEARFDWIDDEGRLHRSSSPIAH